MTVDSVKLLNSYEYATSKMHRIMQGSLIGLSFIYFFYHRPVTIVTNLDMCYLFGIVGFYIGGQIKWILSERPKYDYSWGYHENFHVCVILGHLCAYQLMKLS